VTSIWEADDGGEWLEVVSAVVYLTEMHRPGLTVWDALDEAIRWWTAELLDPRDGFAPAVRYELPWHDPDPLRSTLERLLAAVAPADAPGGHPLSDALRAALTVWVAAMANEFNDGHRFTQPRSRTDRVS
jgi:hypothetical protein